MPRRDAGERLDAAPPRPVPVARRRNQFSTRIMNLELVQKLSGSVIWSEPRIFPLASGGSILRVRLFILYGHKADLKVRISVISSSTDPHENCWIYIRLIFT